MIIFARFFSLLFFFFLCLIKPFRRLQILYIYTLYSTVRKTSSRHDAHSHGHRCVSGRRVGTNKHMGNSRPLISATDARLRSSMRERRSVLLLLLFNLKKKREGMRDTDAGGKEDNHYDSDVCVCGPRIASYQTVGIEHRCLPMQNKQFSAMFSCGFVYSIQTDCFFGERTHTY